MIAPARTAALYALRAIHAGRSDLPSAFARSRERLDDPRDRALTLEIVAGTLRWQRALDHLIARFSNRPLETLDEDVLVIVRLSLFQILHLDRVPAAAVVDDAVDLCRAVRHDGATRFVNAVLRTTLRNRGRLPLPARPGPTADRSASLAYLGITCSHPDWLVERWLDRHGFEAAERWVHFNNTAPRLTLRVNRLRATREALQASLAADGITVEPTRFAANGLTVTAGNPLGTAAAESFVVQDEASQVVTRAVAAQPGERVLDLCASPGGKTTDMAADMGDAGVLIACDVRSRRMRLLRDTVASSGARSVRLVHVPASGPLPFTPSFDRVLVDAPCSGLGTIRRDPDIRWHRSADDLIELGARQSKLLARAASVVAPGGRLVYATCSSEPEENERVVRDFLSAHQNFALVDLRGEFSPLLKPLLDEEGMLRTLPFAHALEAFFAAALVRRS
ncbi:MAG TPA: 16S rRNA (cytosine(967)-C(5))-methyltransferase RsmB [Vicinamibacterales bacterium]|nr:16S rRNA (cytosine(967)-C(5))-methyltransferase RsmB [Vicinamibacterales bacterium]